MQKVVQIENTTLDELVQRVSAVITPAPARPIQALTAMITVLNKKNAAKTLNIGGALFDKLQAMGIIPPTVNAGVNNDGQLIQRWAQHHLIAIKPVIAQLRHKQSEKDFNEAKQMVRQILGL